MPTTEWRNIERIGPRNFTCGYCGVHTGPDLGYRNEAKDWLIYVCTSCLRPTFFEGRIQAPGAAFGTDVGNLPSAIASIYREARNCMAVCAFTASCLACRKVLMNVAVTLGAPGNQTFRDYVNYLDSEGYIPRNARVWVDHIREKGNEATHEIPDI